MGRLVPTHIGNHGGVVPPREAVEALVDHGPGHWYWEGDFSLVDRVDRVATFSWYPPAPGSGVVRYVVTRLLWGWANPDRRDSRVILRNVCDVMACVRPDHVEATGTFGPVALLPGARLPGGTSVRLLAAKKIAHIVPVDASAAICGRVFPMGAQPQPDGTAIACMACLAEWRARGLPTMAAGGPL